MAAAFALAIIRGNNIFICISETTAVVSEILFSREKLQRQPASIHAVHRASDFQIGETQKIL